VGTQRAVMSMYDDDDDDDYYYYYYYYYYSNNIYLSSNHQFSVVINTVILPVSVISG
jgi:hypothetical protein